MAKQTYDYSPIAPGYDWELIANLVDIPLFEEGMMLRSQIRTSPCAPLLGTLTTADGTLVRLDDNRVHIKIPAAMSAHWSCDRIGLDIVADFPLPMRQLGFQLQIAVREFVTPPTEAA